MGLKCQNKGLLFLTSSRGMGQHHTVLAHKNKRFQLCSRPALSYPFSTQWIFWETFYGGANINGCIEAFFILLEMSVSWHPKQWAILKLAASSCVRGGTGDGFFL